MASHLGQNISNHVTLELVGGIIDGYGSDKLGWWRILADGSKQLGPSGGTWVVPAGQHLVLTDIDWQFDDHGTANAGVLVVLRLFVVKGRTDQRLIESSIVLSDKGQGGTVTSWTAGGVFGPGTSIGIDTAPIGSTGKLQHTMLHGYLT